MADIVVPTIADWPGVAADYIISGSTYDEALLTLRLSFVAPREIAELKERLASLLEIVDNPDIKVLLKTTLLDREIELDVQLFGAWLTVLQGWVTQAGDDESFTLVPEPLLLYAPIPIVDLEKRDKPFPLVVELLFALGENTAVSALDPRNDGDFALSFTRAFQRAIKLAHDSAATLWCAPWGLPIDAIRAGGDWQYFAPAPLSQTLMAGEVEGQTLQSMDLEDMAAVFMKTPGQFFSLPLAPERQQQARLEYARVVGAWSETIVPILKDAAGSPEAINEARWAFYDALIADPALGSRMPVVVQSSLELDAGAASSDRIWHVYGEPAQRAVLAASNSCFTTVLASGVTDASHQVAKMSLRPIGVLTEPGALQFMVPEALVDLGTANIPLPFRRVPGPPVITQTRTLYDQAATTVEDAVLYQTEVTCHASACPQDRFCSIEQTASPQQAPQSSTPLFEALAHFVVRAPALVRDPDGDTPQEMAALVSAVADAWPREETIVGERTSGMCERGPTFVFGPCHVLAAEQKKYVLWTERNYELIEGAETNPLFLYESQTIEAPRPLPSNEIRGTIDLNAIPGTTLTEKLAALFAKMGELPAGSVRSDATITLAASYCCPMSDEGMSVKLPIMLVNKIPWANAVALPAAVSSGCEDFISTQEPSTQDAHVELDITAFGGETPLLRLTDVRFAMSAS